MLARDHRALDHEDVEPGLERDLVVAGDALRRQGGGADHALRLDLADPLGDQLLLDRLAVDLLHLAGRLFLAERGDPLELLLSVLITREDALEVEHGEPPEAADRAGGGGRDDPVHRAGQQRQLEAVVAELPADVDVVRIARAAGGHDCDVVKPVCAPRLLATADLYFHCTILGLEADERRYASRLRRRRTTYGEHTL